MFSTALREEERIAIEAAGADRDVSEGFADEGEHDSTAELALGIAFIWTERRE